MFTTMTSQERIQRLFEYREAEYFSPDCVVGIGVDNSLRYEEKLLVQNDDFKAYSMKWGTTQKSFAMPPEFKNSSALRLSIPMLG